MERLKTKSVKFKNEFETQHGKFYNFTVEFETGISGTYVSKSNPQTKFVAGQEIDVEIQSDEKYGNKIKPVQAQQNGYAKKPFDKEAETFKQFLILAQSSMTKSVDLVINGSVKIEQLQATCDRLMQQQIDLATKYKLAHEKPEL